jgi:hypothetical protein
MTGLFRVFLALMILMPVVGHAQQPQPEAQAQQQLPPQQAEQSPPVQPQQQAEQQPVQPQPVVPAQEQPAQPVEAAATPPVPLTPEEQAQQDAIKAVMDDEKKAIQKVAGIVNQPVTHYMRLPSIQPGIYPTWFHDGAIKPDFNKVDVRKTQEFPYAKFEYVASDLSAREMFKSDELEFNAQTKFFYIDRTVPKKKLTQPEMVEINRLYRIIGQDERKAQALRAGEGKKSFKSTIFKALGILIAAAVAFLFAMKKPKPPAAKA